MEIQYNGRDIRGFDEFAVIEALNDAGYDMVAGELELLDLLPLDISGPIDNPTARFLVNTYDSYNDTYVTTYLFLRPQGADFAGSPLAVNDNEEEAVKAFTRVSQGLEESSSYKTIRRKYLRKL